MDMDSSHKSAEVLTVSQLADEWHVSKRSILRYVAGGKLAALKLPGGQLRISRADADAAITRIGSEQASA